MAVPNQTFLPQLHTSLIFHKELQININLPLMHTGQLQISASLHSRFRNAEQQKPAELKQEKSFIPKRDVIQMLNVGLDLYLADG